MIKNLLRFPRISRDDAARQAGTPPIPLGRDGASSRLARDKDPHNFL